MDSEQTIYDEFFKGDLKYLDAIGRLEKLGESPIDAERMVDEWIDANSQFGVGA